MKYFELLLRSKAASYSSIQILNFSSGDSEHLYAALIH